MMMSAGESANETTAAHPSSRRAGIRVRFKQAVYGSFPFWDRGYGILARSAGCRPEWLDALKRACQGYGERPAGVADADGLFVKRIGRGPWMIVGAFPQGCDDGGRPGALAFHALFVGRWMYARAGADPFVFSGLLRRVWSLEDRGIALPPGRATVRRAGYRASSDPAASVVDGRREAIIDALKQGR